MCLNHVTHAVALCIQVVLVFGVRGDGDGDVLHDIESVAGKPLDLERVVGEEAQVAHTEVAQYLGSDSVVAQVGGVAELDVGIHGVVALLLELLGVQLIVELYSR